MAIDACKEKVKREEKFIFFRSRIFCYKASMAEISEFQSFFSALLFFREGKGKAGIAAFLLKVNVTTKEFSINFIFLFISIHLLLHLLASCNY